MNRLVIVGNGFDLAHGLPTGYCDFIDWYWRDILNDIVTMPPSYQSKLIDIQLLFKNTSLIKAGEDFKKVTSYKELIEFINQYSESYTLEFARHFDRCYIKFKNSFFEIICNQYIENWVDIENEYYKLLKDCLKEKDNYKVKKLNEEFEQVKQLLERYLQEEICSEFDFGSPNKYSEKFTKNFIVKPRIFEGSLFLEEFPERDHIHLKKEDEDIREAYRNGTLLDEIWDRNIKEENLFLNFNYTFSLDYYKSFMNSQNWREAYGIATHIQIHGRLSDPDNQVNFGFGDEMDKHYQEIEEKDDNEYLKYIKSFQYLQNSNYKRVLDFIDGEKFQVYIMGHSCGLSDRILLNTIFEHENCRSIKVFYYKNGDWDNYTEIVQNISRHFNKKKLMRDKIVNKSLCQPLPQDIRFVEK